MIIFRKKVICFILAGIMLIGSANAFVYAQTATPTTSSDSSQKEDLQKQIADLEGKVSDLKSQGDSLSSQIGAMDNQIKLTEVRMNATQQQISDLSMDIDSASKRMNNLEGSLNQVTKTLINRVVATYQMGGAEGMQVLVASNDVKDLASRTNYLRLVQEHDKKLLYDTQQARNDYANQKNIFEEKKKRIETLKAQLQEYSTQMEGDKKTKEKLLADTKGSEANYQRMLSAAKAQLSSFSHFATSQGGASILPPQASPDGWYYNQRDSRWGNMTIGSSPEPIWEVGCLLSSVAMVMKKHGENVTPGDIAANSSYFFANTAYMSLPWGGGKFSGGSSFNQSAIDSKLASGEPVIVSVRYGAHFIVLKSGSGGNYVMNDPWNGPDLNFSDFYSTGSITQYGWYN